MAPKKQIHLNFMDLACAGSHMGIGGWKSPKDNTSTKDTLEYYLWLAKLAEKGKITSIFFADTYAGIDPFNVYKGNADATFRGGQSVAQLDPVVMISAMAAVSKSVSFAITGNTSYIPPYLLARTWGTLDHMTKGRIAWNIVTGYSNSAAAAMGQDKVTPHDKRYAEAHEYMDVMYSFWEGSWEDGAQLFSPEKGAYDPDKIHKITFNGEFFKTSAYSQSHPSPQRTPVLFQAGASKAGKSFCARHAEAVLSIATSPAEHAALTKEVRAMAVAEGRDPYDIKFFQGMAPILGRTVEEAQAKFEIAKEFADWQGGLATVSGFTGVDFSKYPLDEPFNFEGEMADNTVHTMVESVQKAMGAGVAMTPRELGKAFSLCGFGSTPIGTPEMVADLIEEWINVGDIDALNFVYVSNPGSFEDIVELLVPVLMERSIMWKDYAVPGGTYRENLSRTPGEKILPERHIAAQYRYSNLKKRFADERGDIIIDRKKVALPKAEKRTNAVELSNGVKRVKVCT